MNTKILIKNGQLQDDSLIGSITEQQQRIQYLINKAAQEDKPLLIHLHGGLVSRGKGESIVDRLAPVYGNAGAVPLFFVWQTGLIETIQANYKEIFQRALSRWGIKFIKRRLRKNNPRLVSIKSISQNPKETEITTIDIEKIDNEKIINEELANYELDHIAQRLWDEYNDSVKNDELLDTGLPIKRASEEFNRAISVHSDTAEAETLKHELFKVPQEVSLLGWQSVISIVKRNIIVALIRATINVINRFRNQTHHGFQATVMEELSREIHGDKFGALIWNLMKSDAKQAFEEGEQYSGSWLLTCLENAPVKPRVMLVGHSAGSIFICEMLKQKLANITFEIAFLAPAITYREFYQTLALAENKISEFRMFAMYDELEKRDDLINVIPYLYPSSLLYLVSGILESKVDEPILGMERFYSHLYGGINQDIEILDRVRNFLDKREDRIVWSRSNNGPGLRSNSADHGNFDETDKTMDGETIESICHIIIHGFHQ